MMEDLTQKSSLSLTQENSESVYGQFDIQRPSRDDYTSTATPDDNQLPTQANPESLHSRYESARTESTALTYQEGDPRHIKVDFNMAPAQEVNELDESQDASFSVPHPIMTNHSYEPQTPAPPVNPFLKRGTVMNGHELFRATQPSSVGRPLETPASARPSPNVYTDFSSPPKRIRRMQSSPLPTCVEVETSPLQSSVRRLLSHSMSMDSPQVPVLRTSGIQSFDVGPREAIYEPRAYVSMAKSQERRTGGGNLHGSDHESDSDSDIEIVPRYRRRRTALRIQQELAAVRKKNPSSRTSSAPVPVEVPSTRTPEDEAYIAQFEDSNVEVTQQIENTQSQDDIIVDSQALPSLENPPSHVGALGMKEDMAFLPNSQPGAVNVLQPSLPPERVSPKRLESHTPTSSKGQSPGLDTVPETSPPPNKSTSPSGERLRPMGEIASFSFGEGEGDNLLDEIVGLTQDVDFEHTRTMQGSSPVAPRLHSRPSEIIAHLPVLTPAATRPNHISDVQPSQIAEDELESLDTHGNKQEEKPITHNTPNPNKILHYEDASNMPDNLSTNSITAEKAQTTVLMQEEVMDTDATSTMTYHRKESSIASPRSNLNSLRATQDKLVSADQVEGNGDALHTISSCLGTVQNDEKIDISKPTHDIDPSDGEALLEMMNDSHRAPSPSKALDNSKHNPSKDTQPAKSSIVTPRQPSRISKKSTSRSSKSRAASATSSSTIPRLSPLVNVETPGASSSNSKPRKRSAKRKSGVSVVAEEGITGLTRLSKRKSGSVVLGYQEPVAPPTRSSKRQSMARESSEDPLALPTSGTTLFANMAFAVSYVHQEKEREKVTQFVVENGGRILQDGFEVLFEPSKSDEDTELRLLATARGLGFTALIADEHSRRAKYMQALALGLPCISGLWVTSCVSKGRILDWSPYLLSAGMSSILRATKSRILSPYPAMNARLEDIISSRGQLLNDKAILFITGKTKVEIEKRKAYTFLARALGPARLSHTTDLQEARKMLNEADKDNQHPWNVLYVDVDEQKAKQVVFGPAVPSRKRKKGLDSVEESSTPAPKRIRVIADETMVQSLIMGQLMED
jgi:hypothetical protein